MNEAHIKWIHTLLASAGARGLPLWLESGWAVDARLNRITREHEDIDLAVPLDRIEMFKDMLRSFGADGFEAMDYGFLVRLDGILLDCEPCVLIDGCYELDGVPRGACPDEKQGVIDGVPVRCTSWAAILWEYFHYLQEVAYSRWPPKDRAGYRLVREVVGDSETERLHGLFRSGGSR